MRREVGRRRGGADADVGEVRVLDQRVSLGHVRREHHGLHVLDVKLRHDDVGHRVRDLHVAGEALDLVVQELAVVLGPPHAAEQVRREPDPAHNMWIELVAS
jgi:hypothetical protein